MVTKKLKQLYMPYIYLFFGLIVSKVKYQKHIRIIFIPEICFC